MNKTYFCFPNFKTKALTLSYDDGVRQDKRLISIMKKHGIKGTFNINGGMFGTEYTGEEKGRMTKQEALDLYLPSGMEVAIHGYKHYSLARVDTSLAINDVVTDRNELEGMFNQVITGMAYANGSYNDEVVELLKKMGVTYSRTVTATENFEIPTDYLRLPTTCHHNNPKLMELAKQFVEIDTTRYWATQLKLFYLWGHSYEFDTNDNWQVIEEFCEYMGNREDIWYATNIEIISYLQALETLTFSMDGSMVKNPSGIDLYINYTGTQCLVPAGKTVKIKTGEVLN